MRFYFFLFFCFGWQVLYSQCDRVSDSLALVDFYNSAGGVGWTYSQSISYNGVAIQNSGNKWDFSQPIDTWHGVSLTEDGCVLKLDLYENGLSGNVTDINFPQLESLILNNNNLSGSIPNFSRLSNLMNLQCLGNDFTGSIPNFTNLPKIRVIDFSGNSISGNIPDFSSCPDLTGVFCRSNRISGSIPTFSNSLKLEVLSFENNLISGQIPNFNNLPNIRFIDFSQNQLFGCFSIELDPEKLCEINCINIPIGEALRLQHADHLIIGTNRTVTGKDIAKAFVILGKRVKSSKKLIYTLFQRSIGFKITL